MVETKGSGAEQPGCTWVEASAEACPPPEPRASLQEEAPSPDHPGATPP